MTLAERTRTVAATAPAVGRSRRTLADELRLALADDIVPAPHSLPTTR